MGDLNPSDCSWKKMVIMKENNKWVSSIKIEEEESRSLGVINENGDTLEAEKNECKDNIKLGFVTMEVESMIQELDPLLIQQTPTEDDKTYTPSKRCGRRGRRQASLVQPETSEDRASRLAKMSAYSAQRIANESPEQRALRLKRMSQYSAKRLAQESDDQRAKRLARMSEYSAKRLANETPEQRQHRLTRMSAYAAKRNAMKKLKIQQPQGS